MGPRTLFVVSQTGNMQRSPNERAKVQAASAKRPLKAFKTVLCRPQIVNSSFHADVVLDDVLFETPLKFDAVLNDLAN